jgi:hypothetical protein
MTLLTLWQRRTELVTRYARLVADHRWLDSQIVASELQDVTTKIMKMEIKLDRRRAA